MAIYHAFWFVGILLLVASLLVVFLILPGVGWTPRMGEPDIHLPKIGAAFPHDAPKIGDVNPDHEPHR